MLRASAVAGVAALMFSAGACSDSENSVSGYDPAKATRITSLFPDSGGYFDKVILKGENFGTDAKKIRVFFNKKEAYTVGASGDELQVYVPKLPGDNCRIGMLIGDSQDTIYSDMNFRYIKNYQLIYVAGQYGKSSNYFDEGDLQTTTLANSMEFLCCDPDGVIYMNHNDWDCKGSAVYLNEPENYTKFLVCAGKTAALGGGMEAPVYDEETEKIYFCMTAAPYMYIVDPKDNWSFVKKPLMAPTEAYINKGYRPLSGSQTLETMYNYTLGKDGYYYGRTYAGMLYRFKLSDRVYDIVGLCPKGAGTNYICADPDDRSKIYCALREKNIITVLNRDKDPLDPDFETVVCGQEGGVGGYLDGNKSIAEMKYPKQILVMRDPETDEKVLYICDTDNYCIRKFNTVTNMMTTVAGIGGSRGYATGDPSVSKLSYPTGMCITPDNDIYICDQGNHVIMKLEFM